MEAVLATSIDANCSSARYFSDEIEPAPFVANVRATAPNNLSKLCAWNAVLQHSICPTVFLDADTYVRQDLAPIWQYDFDVAYTVRPGHRPVIGGVLFVRPTERTRFFFLRWIARAASLLMRPGEIGNEMHMWGGLNQSCLNALTRGTVADVNILAVPAAIWNSCDETWHRFGPETRIVHLKGELRQEIMSGGPDRRQPASALTPIVVEWLEYLRQAYQR